MPTLQVTPDASALLQGIADSLGKAKKVVVVTGAGISTNTGIPDFRSANGLYSLIQKQFENAAASGGRFDEDAENELGDGPPAKRRKVDADPNSSQRESLDANMTEEGPEPEEEEVLPRPPESREDGGVTGDDATGTSRIAAEEAQDPDNSQLSQQSTPSGRRTRSQAALGRPSNLRHSTASSIKSMFSQDSMFSSELSAASSQTEDSIVCFVPEVETSGPSEQNTSTPTRIQLGEPLSSSPLSSPPAILFNPYDNDSSSVESSEVSDDSSDSGEEDDTQTTIDFFSSQTSSTSLRTMKGRDLFDCNIWSDPLKTSVFYRFATTLRQKSREAEPTMTHRFIAQLKEVGKLARVYTQNIDEIEKKLGLSTDLKNGAGNRRRKSTKLQAAEPDNAPKDAPDQTKSEDDASKPDAASSQDASQGTDGDADRAKTKQTFTVDKGVDCVCLHGSLHALRCFLCGRLCDWDADDRENRTMSGEQPDCPHCAGATAAREERGKRALGVGKLRPDVVLYGEEHPQSDLISPIVQHDLSNSPDLLLILGTSLKVHGLKIMVKEFAKAVHNKGGKVVFINFTKPAESIWGDIIDYWIEWDCDAWVDDLRERKPVLWLSPEEVLEQEKQKREAIAEKKRETLKKRESLNEKRRQSTGTDPSKAPPKNPSCMRNDYTSAAYWMWQIETDLANIGGREAWKLDLPSAVLASMPAANTDTKPPIKAKKPRQTRKSAPAALEASEPVIIPEQRSQPSSQPQKKPRKAPNASAKGPPSTKDLWTKAARSLGPRALTPARLAELRPPPIFTSGLAGSTASIGASVKTHPRVRKPKLVDGVPVTTGSSQRRMTLPLPQPQRQGYYDQENYGSPRAFNEADCILPNTELGTPTSPLSSPPPLRAIEPKIELVPRSPLSMRSPNLPPRFKHHYSRPLSLCDPLTKWEFDQWGRQEFKGVKRSIEVDAEHAHAHSHMQTTPTHSPSDQLFEESEQAAQMLSKAKR